MRPIQKLGWGWIMVAGALAVAPVADPVATVEATKIAKVVEVVSSDEPRFAGQLFGPRLCPLNPDYLTFVRQQQDNRQVWFMDLKTRQAERITPNAHTDKIEDMGDDEGGFFHDYADQVEWCPVAGKIGPILAYVSAGGGNNMDIYVHEIGSGVHTRLTWNAEVDESPRWSPDGKNLVFVSARTGNGDLYMIEGVQELVGMGGQEALESKIVRLTESEGEEMFPAYAPGGRYLAFTVRTSGKFKRGPYTIALMDFGNRRKIQVFNNQIPNSKSHPSWSFDGHFVAYQISNDLNDQVVDLGVMQLKTDPMGRLVEVADLVGNTPKIAENIFPNTYQGPSWLPGSRAIAYARRESSQLNPLEVVNLEKWLYNPDYQRTPLTTSSSIHRDVDCLANHPLVVFAGQSGLSFKIFGALLSGSDVKLKNQGPSSADYAIFRQ